MVSEQTFAEAASAALVDPSSCVAEVLRGLIRRVEVVAAASSKSLFEFSER